jgi:hypothetical protein
MYSNSLSIHLSIYIYIFEKEFVTGYSFLFLRSKILQNLARKKTSVNNNEYGWTTEYCCWRVASQNVWQLAQILNDGCYSKRTQNRDKKLKRADQPCPV